jgi:hypothetical protein
MGISWVATLAAGCLLLVPTDTLFVALLPTAFVFTGVGIVMHQSGKTLSYKEYIEYALVILLIIAVLLTEIKWGIAGAFWM